MGLSYSSLPKTIAEINNIACPTCKKEIEGIIEKIDDPWSKNQVEIYIQKLANNNNFGKKRRSKKRRSNKRRSNKRRSNKAI